MGFRGKQVLALTLVAACVALATSAVNATLVARARVDEARDGARTLARTLYHLASPAIRGRVADELPGALSGEAVLRQYSDAVVGYSPVTLYLAIVDTDGIAMFHSNPRLSGEPLDSASFAPFPEDGSLSSLWALMRSERALVVDLPFALGDDEPVGSVQVAVSTVLLRRQLLATLATNAAFAGVVVLFAFAGSLYVANRLLAPIDALRRELARIDPGPGQPRLDFRNEEDVGRLAEFFSSIGKQLDEQRGEEPSRDWIRTMVAGVTDAVIVLDAEGGVLSLNDRASRLLGLDDAATEGKPLDAVLPRDHPLVGLAHEARRSRSDLPARRLSLNVGDDEAPLLAAVRHLGAGSDTSGMIVTVRDLEGIARLTSHLSYSQKVAALGRLTSGVAHEIRNPLNAMIMNTALLRDRAAGDAEVERRVDALDEGIRRLDRVVEGFLAFSRPERLRIGPVDLAGLLREIAGLAAGPRTTGVRVETEFPPDLPPVSGDEDLLRQVFTNLVNNAREAMPDGGVVRVGARVDGSSVRATVADTGSGIPEQELPDIFKLFHTTKERGSGIGLSIVYRIVQLHGGDVTVDSVPAVGTTFTITLPRETV